MEHKIILTGPVGAGKTTAISALSDIPVVKTGARANDAVAMRKDQTTVAMDYGVLALDGGVQLHLYGTPGQERFSFMWDMELFLGAFRRFIHKTGVARMDVNQRHRLDAYPGTAIRTGSRYLPLAARNPHGSRVPGREHCTCLTT